MSSAHHKLLIKKIQTKVQIKAKRIEKAFYIWCNKNISQTKSYIALHHALEIQYKCS